MNINATLIGQSVAFVFFVWFCMRYIWPPLLKVLETRKKRIADGLAAAEEGVKKLEYSNKEASDILRVAQLKAQDLVDKANKQSILMLEEAKESAIAEGLRLKEAARLEVAQEVDSAKIILRKQVATLAILGAEKVIGQSVDEAANSKLINDLVAEL